MFKNLQLRDLTQEEKTHIEKYGCCTAWELFAKYGITSQKVSAAIKKGLIMGVKKVENGDIHLRNYLVRDSRLDTFIEKNKKYNDEKITLSRQGTAK